MINYSAHGLQVIKDIYNKAVEFTNSYDDIPADDWQLLATIRLEIEKDFLSIIKADKGNN